MTKKQPRPDRPLPLKWEFGPDIPTYDFIKDYRLDEPWGVEEAVEDFIYKIEKDDFLAWEAVMAEEQGLPLTEKQQAAVDELLDFSDEGNDRVLYIDEIPRPIEPWHVILNKIVPHILVEPFRTVDVHYGVHSEGWRNLAACLAKHGDGLSLPQGASSPLEVIPLELRHTLWLQGCFDALSGLGQDEELTLENEEQQDRVEMFIANLAAHADSVHYFNLTLDSLLERVILPEKDRPIFVKMMQEKLGIKSTAEPIVNYLGEEVQLLLAEKARLEREEQRLLAEKEKLGRENESTQRETQRVLLEEERLKRELREAKEVSLRRQVESSQSKRIGRNDPCPCGSGKKFKRCCIKKYGGDVLD